MIRLGMGSIPVGVASGVSDVMLRELTVVSDGRRQGVAISSRMCLGSSGVHGLDIPGKLLVDSEKHHRLTETEWIPKSPKKEKEKKEKRTSSRCEA